MNNTIFSLIFVLILTSLNTKAQEGEIIDKIIAVVGNEIVMYSEVEAQYEQYLASGSPVDETTRCFIFEDILLQKLMLNQSKLDSVEVSEQQIQTELDRRLRYFISQFGSEKKLEEFYHKTILELKDEFHDMIKEQLMIQTVQGKISQDVKVTPSEVRAYYETIPKDSLPFVSSEVEIAHIIKKPPVNEAEKEIAKDKLRKIKDRVLKGENFGTLAYLYSEDPGSAMKNGELGFMSRNSLVPEFSAAGFSLKPGEISEIVETEYGYHLLQLIERRGEEANIRHILIKPKTNPIDLVKAKQHLDSIYNLLKTVDTLSFDIAAEKFSEDEDTKQNGGKMINYQTGTSKFKVDELGQMDPTLTFTLNKMKIGDVSTPSVMQLPDGTQAYRIIKLISRTDPHRANLVDDYQQLQEEALINKQTQKMIDWVNKTAQKSYVRIDDSFKSCELSNNWNIN